MLELKYDYHSIEAGCDEAGRGCLAGPVFAAAVILPDNFSDELLKAAVGKTTGRAPSGHRTGSFGLGCG